MKIKELSILMEKLIDSINAEESDYIRNSELKRLSSTQIHYLDLIYHEKDATASLLAERLKVTKPSATVHIEKLVKLGYVRKVKSDADGRVQYLELTKEGVSIARMHDRFHEVFTRKLTARLDTGETEKLTEIFKKVFE